MSMTIDDQLLPVKSITLVYHASILKYLQAVSWKVSM